MSKPTNLKQAYSLSKKFKNLSETLDEVFDDTMDLETAITLVAENSAFDRTDLVMCGMLMGVVGDVSVSGISEEE